MSVLYDYFRAPDSRSAIDWAIGPGGDWRQYSGTGLDDHGADWIDAKNLDPSVVLGQLIAFAQGVLFQALSATPVLIWPDKQSWPPGEQRLGQQSPWDEGLFLEQLPDEWITLLADIDDEQLPRLAQQWMSIEEISFADPDDAKDSIETFCALARRTRDHGHNLYCKSVV